MRVSPRVAGLTLFTAASTLAACSSTTAAPEGSPTASSVAAPTKAAVSARPAKRAAPSASRMQAAIKQALITDAKVDVSEIKGAGKTLLSVTVDETEGISDGLVATTLRHDAALVLHEARNSGLKYTDVEFFATYPMTDEYGNTSQAQVVAAHYTKTVINRIDFGDFSERNVWEIAETSSVQPDFQ